MICDLQLENKRSIIKNRQENKENLIFLSIIRHLQWLEVHQKYNLKLYKNRSRYLYEIDFLSFFNALFKL